MMTPESAARNVACEGCGHGRENHDYSGCLCWVMADANQKCQCAVVAIRFVHERKTYLSKGETMGDEPYLCDRCGVNWVGAPGHPKSYCDSIFYPAEVKRLELQVDGLKKDLAFAKEVEATGDKMLGDASRLNGEMRKALDHLFSDPGIHPVVMRRFVGSSQEGVPTIDEGIQKCKRCVDALLAVSEAYFALKRKCGLAKPLGSGERCVREFGHLEPCDHR